MEIGRSDRGKAMSSGAAGRVYGKHGGYRNLKAYRVSELLYDHTCRFCDRFVPKWDRHCDQMVQAGRSGYQNIAEGSFSERLYRARTGTSRRSVPSVSSAPSVPRDVRDRPDEGTQVGSGGNGNAGR